MNPQPYSPGKPGIFRMEAKDYHAAPGVGKHSLDAIFDSPAMYQLLKKHGFKSTEAMEFSTLCHTAILEPDKLKDSFVMRPETYVSVDKKGNQEIKPWSGNSNTCKAWLAANEGKQVLTKPELETIQNIAQSCRNHPIVGALLEEGEAEISLFAECPYTGMLRKGRPDWITADEEGKTVLVDFKFVADANRHAFRKQLETLRYHVQHAYYVDLCELLGQGKPRFLFVVVQKTPMHPDEPKHKVRVEEVHEVDVEFGRNMYIRDLLRLQECIKTDTWKDDTDKIGLMTLSSWYRKENAV